MPLLPARSTKSTRVLERIFCLRVERLLVEELCARQSMESSGKLFVAEVAHAPENRLGEVRADDRRRLQQSLIPLGQAVDSRNEHALHGRGQAKFLHRCG
jgi:hypothetical protein